MNDKKLKLIQNYSDNYLNTCLIQSDKLRRVPMKYQKPRQINIIIKEKTELKYHK
jgi:hypothetical protein